MAWLGRSRRDYNRFTVEGPRPTTSSASAPYHHAGIAFSTAGGTMINAYGRVIRVCLTWATVTLKHSNWQVHPVWTPENWRFRRFAKANEQDERRLARQRLSLKITTPIPVRWNS